MFTHMFSLHVVDVKGAQQENFEFNQTLYGCVSCFKSPKEFINKVVRIRDKAETYATIRGAVAHIPSKRSLLSAPLKFRVSLLPGFSETMPC